MLIRNDNHFHTPYVVVRLSALYKKSWILIRLTHSNILYIRVLPMYICSVIPTCVENLWETLKFLWIACGKPMEIVECNIYHTHL